MTQGYMKDQDDVDGTSNYVFVVTKADHPSYGHFWVDYARHRGGKKREAFPDEDGVLFVPNLEDAFVTSNAQITDYRPFNLGEWVDVKFYHNNQMQSEFSLEEIEMATDMINSVTK